MNTASETLEKIRQQFDHAPYPNQPLEKTVTGDRIAYFKHSLITPYYLRDQQIPATEGKLILDAGCGSGFKAMCLAEANPGARIVGVDISEESVKLARSRMAYHRIENTEFHAIGIEALPQLGLQFDYINCDEVIYLLPDPQEALQIMQSVLAPNGIIRVNFHSLYQRITQYRGQALFRMMGLMENAPTEFEAGVVREIFSGLQKGVDLKDEGWAQELEDDDYNILANYLLTGDRGHTLEEVFTMLAAADLQLISMVNWKEWSLWDLLVNPADPPAAWAMCLEMASLEEQLCMYELVNPVHRLLDFWCGHPFEPTWAPVSDWSEAKWQGAIATLHPFTITNDSKAAVIQSIQKLLPLEIDRKPVIRSKSTLDSGLLPILLALWDGPQPVPALVDRYMTLNPIHPRTMEPLTRDRAATVVQGFLADQCDYGLVLLELGNE